MRLRCPACGSENTLDVLIAHEGARAAIWAALNLEPVLGPLVGQYLGLFRPVKHALSGDRVALLLGELTPMIHAAQIERNGRAYPAPREIWKQAIGVMLSSRDSLSLPLKNHGYLLSVIANMADSQAKQGQRSEISSDALQRGETQTGAGANTRPEMTKLPVLPQRTGIPQEFRNLINARKKGNTDVSTEPTVAGATTNAADTAAP